MSIFARVVCGVDGTAESLFAVKQANRLRLPEGRLLLVVATSLAKAAHAGIAAGHAAELLQAEAEQALAEAEQLAPAEGKIVNGDPAAILLSEAQQATLLALGSHGRGRAAGMLLGTVAARMLHEAPCSVLISRPARDPETWPETIVAGVDGSAESELAVAAARSVASSCGAELRIVAATSDQVDRDAARRVAPELEERGRPRARCAQGRVRDGRPRRGRQPGAAGAESRSAASASGSRTRRTARCSSCAARHPADRPGR